MGGKCDYNNSVEKFEQDSQSGPAPDRRINTMANCAIVGINWGDEGKGRMVDYLTDHYDVVVRYQGGGNAGHTVVNEKGKFALHLLPSGIFRDGVVNILGNGVALDCENLLKEMETLRAAGVIITPENLKVSDRASLLLPWHRELDALEEARLADKKYGSTKQGIAPFYGDKYQKKTVQAGELLYPEHLKEHLADLLEWKNLMLQKIYGAKGYTMDELMAWVNTYCGAIKPYITDTGRFLRNAQKEGKSILFITHKLNEIMAVADRCTVLRKGKYMGTVDIKDTTKEELSRMMVGRDVQLQVDKKPAHPGDVVLDVEGVTIHNDQRKKDSVKDVTFQVHAGEIVCLAGIEGNGQTELVYGLTGLEKLSGGKITLDGKDITRESIRQRSKDGMSHIPEDRHKHGLVLDYSLENNMVLQRYWQPEFQKGGFIQSDKVREYSDKLIAQYDVRSGQGSSTIVRSMSGGNQQKAIIAREIDKDPKLLVAVQPTRGLDVGAIEYIHRQIVAERDKGKAVLLVSLELDEVMNLSDCILVMYEGEIVGEFDPKTTTVQELGLYMAGARKQGKESK